VILNLMRAKRHEATDSMSMLRVFVSSVQKELEDERVIVQNLLNTDSFLTAHCAPVLYEFEPASADKALEGCLKTLDTCEVYLLIVAVQYGTPLGELSITHAEYRRAISGVRFLLPAISRKISMSTGDESGISLGCSAAGAVVSCPSISFLFSSQ